MILLAMICLFGFASAQKVTKINYCGIDKTHLRIDCVYEVPAESPDVMCKFTQGERIVDTTDPEEEQDGAYKNKAKVRIYPGNICRLRYNNLSEGRTNFSCTVKQTETSKPKSASVEKKLLLPCSALSVLFQNCSGLLLTLMTLPTLLGIHWL